MTRPALRAMEQAYGRAVGALTMLDLLRGQALSEAVRPAGTRTCAECSSPLERRRSEGAAIFNRRLFCSTACARRQPRPKSERRHMERLHLARGMVADAVSQIDDAMLELTRETLERRR